MEEKEWLYIFARLGGNTLGPLPGEQGEICLLLLPSVSPTSESFPVSWLFTAGGQIFRAPASAPPLLMNIQG